MKTEYKNIKIKYWFKDYSGEIGLPNNTVYDYSDSLRNYLVGQIMDYGYNTMISLRPEESTVILFIDDRNFSRR